MSSRVCGACAPRHQRQRPSSRRSPSVAAARTAGAAVPLAARSISRATVRLCDRRLDRPAVAVRGARRAPRAGDEQRTRRRRSRDYRRRGRACSIDARRALGLQQRRDRDVGRDRRRADRIERRIGPPVEGLRRPAAVAERRRRDQVEYPIRDAQGLDR